MPRLTTKQDAHLRTFAGDLDAARKKQGHPTNTTKTKKKDVTPLPKEAPEKKLKRHVKEPLIVVGPEAKEDKKVPAPKKEKAELPKITIVEPTQDHKPETESGTHIPAFHELQQQISAIQDEATQPPTPKAKDEEAAKKKADAPRPNVGYDATVITDTMTDRFSLFPSVITSIRNWFKKIALKRKQKKIPTYSIPETERRKGVIQKATSKTGTMFTSDAETLREQIRKRHQLELAHEEELEKKRAADVTKNVTVTYKQTTSTPEPEPVPEPKVTVNQTEAVQETPPATPAPALEENVPVETTEEPAATPAPTQHIAPPDNTPPKVSLITKDGVTIKEKSQLELNTTVVVLLVVAVCLVAVLSNARAILEKFVPSDTEEAVLVYEKTTPILPITESNQIPMTVADIDHIPDLLDQAAAQASGGIVEFAIMAPDGEEVSPSYIFDLLHFRAIPTFRHSLTKTRFATINHGELLLVLSFVDRETIQGGLLTWEATMSTDLTSLLEISYTTNPVFVDDTIGGIDVRVLSHNNETVLVYGIINDNTAIITTSKEDFAQIAALENAN